MTNFVQLQEFLTQSLLANAALENVNIKSWRKLRLESEVDLSTLWLTPRNGRSGAGILVEMPEFTVPHPNLPGPEALLNCPIAILEEPNINLTPGIGTMLSAEEIAQLILEILHDYQLEGFSTLYAKGNAIVPADEFQGVVAYRVTVQLRLPREQTARVATPTATEAGGNITLACATADAEIYFTLDDSFPGSGNPVATRYTDTFAAEVGQVLRCAAYKPGAPGSHVSKQTVT